MPECVKDFNIEIVEQGTDNDGSLRVKFTILYSNQEPSIVNRTYTDGDFNSPTAQQQLSNDISRFWQDNEWCDGILLSSDEQTEVLGKLATFATGKNYICDENGYIQIQGESNG